MHKVAKGILRKWLWLLASIFAVAFVVLSVFLVWHFAKSVHRFSAETKLLYSPRKVDKFETMSEKQLMSVLDRGSLKRKVGGVVRMSEPERQCLTLDMEIKQGQKQSGNIFTLKAQSGTWKGAVQKVNAYAELLIEEYVQYRKHDLAAQQESLEHRKASYQEQLSAIEGEESLSRSSTGVATPVEALTAINALLSDQRRNLSMLDVQIANEKVRRKRLEANVGTSGAAIVANAATIRRKSAEIAAVDAEISKLRELYTDINPKVLGKLDDRKARIDEYKAFLKDRGIGDIAVEDIERIERAAMELSEVSTKLEVLAESKRSLEGEIKVNEARAAGLTTAVSTMERLRSRRNDLDITVKGIDEQLDTLGYLIASVETDLRQIERAGGAGDDRPIRGRNFLIAAGGSFVITLVVAFWILALELVFGRVRGSVEVSAWGDVHSLGSLPKPGSMGEEEEKDTLGVVALNFCNAEVPKGVVLVCRLEGAGEQPKFREALDWSLAMAGHKAFMLHLVRGADFNPPEGARSLIGAVCEDMVGWFPVENRYSLAPTELQMLKADIDEIRKGHEEVFVLMPGGFRKGGSFFDQLLGVCDSVLLIVGAEETPRSDFAYARRHATTGGRPMLGIVVDASANDVRREMEAGR